MYISPPPLYITQAYLTRSRKQSRGQKIKVHLHGILLDGVHKRNEGSTGFFRNREVVQYHCSCSRSLLVGNLHLSREEERAEDDPRQNSCYRVHRVIGTGQERKQHTHTHTTPVCFPCSPLLHVFGVHYRGVSKIGRNWQGASN